MAENPMIKIKIVKVILNIGVGESGDAIEKAYVLAERLTGHKPVRTTSTKKARTFKMSKGKNIGVKVTLRGDDKVKFLKKVLAAVNNQLKRSSFDNEGNFGFGISEYLEIPGEKYDPKLGVIGMNINVLLERSGFRVKRRKLMKRRIPRNHRVSKEDAITFAEKELGVEIV